MKILGFDYKITEKQLDDENDWGECIPWKSEININKDLSEDKKILTLIHEIIEAGNSMLELKLKHQQITGIELVIYNTLTENGIDLSSLLEVSNENS